MKQIFRPDANMFALVSIFVVAFLVLGGIWVLLMLDRSNYTRRVNLPIEQPIPYSHQLHAGSLGMDCRYCHQAAEVSSFANIPPTETCVTCHHEVLRNSASLDPLWESYNTGMPIEWNKVHDLPDFVYFNHSVHVNSGFGCTECHGQVDDMAVVWREENLTMGWCLDCHRDPAQFIRPVDEVWNMDYVHPDNQLEMGQQLIEEYNIPGPRVLENCYKCHR
jgi:hypothetical protein